jgi:hypothetical protein
MNEHYQRILPSCPSKVCTTRLLLILNIYIKLSSEPATKVLSEPSLEKAGWMQYLALENLMDDFSTSCGYWRIDVNVPSCVHLTISQRRNVLSRVPASKNFPLGVNFAHPLQREMRVSNTVHSKVGVN